MIPWEQSFGPYSSHNKFYQLAVFVFSYITIFCVSALFATSGGIPRDAFQTVHTALFAVMTILASVGILFSVFCIIFNFVFRNKRYYSYAYSEASLDIHHLNLTFLYREVLLFRRLFVHMFYISSLDSRHCPSFEVF